VPSPKPAGFVETMSISHAARGKKFPNALQKLPGSLKHGQRLMAEG
jgi:hypothetical protein